MKSRTATYLAYSALTVAILAWIGVGYFAMLIHTERAAYTARLQETAQKSDQAAAEALTHIIASGNLTRSASLDALVTSDIPSIIGAIMSVGTSTGVSIKISGAVPEPVPKNQKKDVHAVSFLIESTGSFSSLMRAIALLEVVPIASSIDSIDLSQVPRGGDTTARTPQLWHLNIKMRVLTTVPVS